MEGFPKQVLPLLQSCWAEDPKLRPEFKEITETLSTMLHQNRCSARPTLTSINEIEEVDSNGGEEEIPNAQQAPKSQDLRDQENIPKQDDEGTEKPNAKDGTEGDESQSQTQNRAQNPSPDSDGSKPKKKSKLKCLLKYFPCLRNCFGN